MEKSRVITVQIPERLLGGLRKAAEANFTSMATEIRRAIVAHLRQESINWKEDEDKCMGI
jgi:metal-responsive CopG/Arc/MetJ family transcriptional regulator